jgi:hypothetical protein
MAWRGLGTNDRVMAGGEDYSIEDGGAAGRVLGQEQERELAKAGAWKVCELRGREALICMRPTDKARLGS